MRGGKVLFGILASCLLLCALKIIHDTDEFIPEKFVNYTKATLWSGYTSQSNSPSTPLFLPNTIHVILNLDDNYLDQLGIVVYSIVSTTSSQVFFHILYDGNSNTLANHRLDSVRTRTNVDFQSKVYVQECVDILATLPERNKFMLKHITRSTWLRLFSPFVLPGEVEKAIYLDLDVIVASDLKLLYDLNISNGCGLLGCPSRVKSAGDQGINILPEGWKDRWHGMWNAGVVLLNLTMLRRDPAYKEECIDELLIKHGMNDQIVWSLYCPIDEMATKMKTGWNVYVEKELDFRVENAYIGHWAGRIKPWHLPPLCSGRVVGRSNETVQPSHYCFDTRLPYVKQCHNFKYSKGRKEKTRNYFRCLYNVAKYMMA
eukprot:CFRG5689T1